jgi:hypothetical protein
MWWHETFGEYRAEHAWTTGERGSHAAMSPWGKQDATAFEGSATTDHQRNYGEVPESRLQSLRKTIIDSDDVTIIQIDT